MTAIDNWKIWTNLFGDGDQAWHLWIIDDHHVNARVFAEWTTFAGPVCLGIKVDPALPFMNILLLQSC